MKKIILLTVCMVLGFAVVSSGDIWVNEEWLGKYVDDNQTRLIRLMRAHPGKPVKGIRLSASIPKESYKRGEVIKINYIAQNLSRKTRYYRSGEDKMAFVAFSSNNIIVHLPIFVAEKSLGIMKLKPGEKMNGYLWVNTDRFWPEYHENEKGSNLPTNYDTKRAAVAMYLCDEGFWTRKNREDISNRLAVKSNLLEFEVIE